MSPKLHSVALPFFGFVLALGAVGCGSNASSPLASSPIAAAAVATINGSVDTGSGVGSSSFQTSSNSKPTLTVSAVGTGLSTTTDASGHFTLTGVPAGSVALRFQGPGVDATLEISGLAPGQVLTINVHVAGSEASLTPAGSPSPSPSPGDDGEQVELRGPITALGSSSLVVSGKTVAVSAATKIEGHQHVTLTFVDLKVGDSVEVEGTAQTDGSVLATKIKVEDQGNDNAAEVRLTGTVEFVTPPTLQVSGRTVVTNSATDIHSNGAKSLSDILVGSTVEVRGVVQADNSILASRIELKSGGSSGDDDGEDDGGDDDAGDDNGGDDDGGGN